MDASGGYEEFCGGPFWNASLTWHTPNPTLSNCSLWTAVAWLPCLYILLFAPVYFFCYLRKVNNFRSDYKDTKISVTFVLKMILSIGLTITSLSCFIYCCVIYATKGAPQVALVTPPIITVVFVISTFIIWKENDKRLVTSGFHFFFYFLLSITSALFGYSVIWQYLYEWDTNIKERFVVVAYTTFYFLFTVQIAFMLILFCLPDRVAVQILRRNNPNVCPELTTAFLGRIVYIWIFRLLIKGYRKAISLADLWTQFDGQDATLNRETFFEHWNKKRSLLRTLAKMFGPKLLVSHASMACSITAMFLVPFLLSVFIEFFDDPSMEYWKGVLCSLSFFVNYVFESIAWQQMMYVGYDVGARVKATLTSVTFHKILLLDTSSSETGETHETRDDDDTGHLTDYRDSSKFSEEINNRKKKTKTSVFPATPGEAVNLISSDIHNLGEATAQLHLLWAIPVETVMVLALLWWLLSVSVGVMIIIVGVALVAIFVTSRYLKTLQLSQLTHKDGRIKVFSEVINGIKLLKLYTWEEAFEEKVQNNRVAELRSLRRFFYVNSINIFSSLLVPNLTTFVTFSIYSWYIGPLTAKNAFTSMSLFNILQYQLLLMPVISSHFVKAKVSLKRVEAFLQLPELHTYVESSQMPPIGSEPSIQISEGTFSWDATCEPTLKNLNLTLNHKSLTAVVGLVGSGKSSILSAILGEIRRLEGSVKVQGSVAYVSQQAWIQNATLRDNILFGMPYQENKYTRIVEACALKRDLDILTAGDLTVIGEKGINLSGGQKQRVSLARSLYQDCDIYLLDDPLSAVDSHVAKHIFSRVIGPAGYLKNKTRVLVTHAVRFLPYTDHVIVLDDGSIAEQGTYNDLSSSGGRLTRFIESLESVPYDPAKGGPKGVEAHPILGHKSHSRSSHGGKYNAGQLGLEGFDMISVRSRSLVSSSEAQGEFQDEIQAEVDFEEPIISPESVGAVKFGAYKFYASELGYLTLALVFLFFVVFKSFAVMSNVWISYWTGDRAIHESFNTTGWNNGSGEEYYERQKHYISSYGWFVAGHALFLILYCITSIEGNTHASRQTHSSMLGRIIRAPVSFFESTPTGRILNRFSRDLDVLDSGLPDLLHQWLAVFTSLVSTVIIITMSIPMFFAVAVLLVAVFLILQHLYLPTVRQLKWEESNSRSPIYALVCEALTGLDTIRAYQRQAMFERRFDRLINNNTVLNFAANAAERWLGFHLEMMGAVTTFAASMFSLFNRNTLSGSTVGMFMSSSIQDSFSLSYLVRLNSSLETNMVSMERLKEYLHVEVETDPNTEVEIRPSKPRSNRIGRMKMESRPIKLGKIEFVDYSMRYRPDLDYSLRNINVLIDPGQKVGIIGRTGAGKSSLISALFRFNVNVEGFILIDDLDTSALPLKVLRSSMTVLPQDPIIFGGSVRMNLDPLSAHSDLEIWNALQQVKMEDSVKALPGSLDFVCQTDGLNFSVGQRQLLCLGRTLLHKTAILILDEATAAVDLETDKVIQETIRTQFSDCTVLTIAHRINTILSCDRIMLLDNGRVKEYNSPNSIQALNGGTDQSETDKF